LFYTGNVYQWAVFLQKKATACLHAADQGFSTAALLGSKPPTQMNQERVAGFALPCKTGNALFYSFWGGEGKRKKTFEKPGAADRFSLTLSR
jgi:hypothetical protein